MIIHEHTDAAGTRVVTRLVYEDGTLFLVTPDRKTPLPRGVLSTVMARYGRPLEVEVQEVEALVVAETRLVRFRFMPRYDVIARDYLVLYTPDREPLCDLATSVTAVLSFLARK